MYVHLIGLPFDLPGLSADEAVVSLPGDIFAAITASDDGLVGAADDLGWICAVQDRPARGAAPTWAAHLVV